MMTAMPSTESPEGALPPAAVEAAGAAQDCLGASLVATYLHGSAVTGGLRPDSDVDILLVVDRPVDDAPRRRLLAELMRISGRPNRDDPRRPLEVTVFVTAELAAADYPPRCEFVYGEWLRPDFESGALPEPHANPDFLILIAQARQAAVVLSGPPPRELLPQIPDHLLRRAIADARALLLTDLYGDERNVLLTLARMWCTLETGKIVAKDAAAAWAVPRLSPPSGSLLDHARLAYLGRADDDWSALRPEVERVAAEMNERVAALT